MHPYFFLFGFIGFLALISVFLRARILNHILWKVVFLWLIFMIGWRHEVGPDWNAYYDYVERASGEDFFQFFFQQEPAYQLLNWLAANVGGGIYTVNFISACIFIFGLLAFCRNQPLPWLALLVSIPYLIIVVGMGYTRQAVAIGLEMLAITQLLRGKTPHFLLWIIVAAMFHRSAIILSVLVLFANVSRSWVILFGLISATLLLLFVEMVQDSWGGFYDVYIASDYGSSGAVLRIAMNALPALFFLIYKSQFTRSIDEQIFWTWMSRIAVFIFIPMLIIVPYTTALDRLALYLIPLQVFIFSRLPVAFPGSENYNVWWLFFVVVYSACVMCVWLFVADHAYAWVPYKSYLFEMF